MESIYQFSEPQILCFALVFLRVTAFLFAWPIFGNESVPTPVKVLLSIVLAICIFPVVPKEQVLQNLLNDNILFLAAKEMFLGVLLGFFARMFFFAISISGQIISMSSGLASAQMFNPAMGSQVQVLEQFQLALATLFFLMINGHHHLISGLAESFNLIPLSMEALNIARLGEMTGVAQDIMVMGLKMSAPVVVAVFVTNVAMGVLGRAVPQVNILVTSMQVTLLVGLGMIFWTLPLFVTEMTGLSEALMTQFFDLMKVL